VSNASVPFLDLVTPHVELEQELTQVFQQALRTAGFIGGPMVENFEKVFATFCETQHSVAVNSGTDALRFALMASGVRPGDVVVTVPHTFIATTEAISQAGALPEFVDIDEHTYNMGPGKLREYLEEQCVREVAGKLISRRSGRPVPVDSLTIEDEPDGRVVYSRNAHDERRSLTRCPSLVGRLSAPAPDCLRRPRLSSRSDTAFRPARRSTESRCA